MDEIVEYYETLLSNHQDKIAHMIVQNFQVSFGVAVVGLFMELKPQPAEEGADPPKRGRSTVAIGAHKNPAYALLLAKTMAFADSAPFRPPVPRQSFH